MKNHRKPFSRALPGITLVEILIAIALLGVVMGIGFISLSSYAIIGLRSGTSKTSALISYLAHEAVIKGRPMRLVVDLGSNTYRAEMMAQTDDRAPVYLAEVEKRKQGDDPDAPKEDTKSIGLGVFDLLKPPISSRPKPAWEPLAVPGLKLDPLADNVEFAAIYTPQQEEPFTEGPGYLYFWPTGQTEHALLYLSLKDADEDEDDKFFSILIDAMTGRAKVSRGRYEFPADAREFDNPGDEEEEDE